MEVRMENKSEEEKKQYNDYVKEITPTTNTLMNVIKAFFVGGLICLLGQILGNGFREWG